MGSLRDRGSFPYLNWLDLLVERILIKVLDLLKSFSHDLGVLNRVSTEASHAFLTSFCGLATVLSYALV
jgi:hypothetical protein